MPHRNWVVHCTDLSLPSEGSNAIHFNTFGSHMVVLNSKRAANDLPDHSLAAAIIMMIAYGHQINSERDKYVKLAEEVRASGVGPPGSYLVDVLPALKYIPEWFPENGTPSSLVRLTSGLEATCDAPPCMASRLVETLSSMSGIDKDELIMICTEVIYGAAIDTTVTALTTFILAMIMHPEIQQKAQAEIDSRSSVIEFQRPT
ncbi:hypothetical protein BS17DRAFT_820359 [Gyrodon lividus]|nr:hypothetical protein BS17DRAFT_820359 [Gyrodon lividus]